MAAPKGNKYAEKVTLEDAIELAELAYSKIDNECYFLSKLADECDTYREKFDYILKKFNDNEEVFRTIKKIYNKCESIVMEKTAKGEIIPSLGIFVLKAYHGLMETSKQQIDHKNDGGKFEQPKNDLTPEQMDKLIDKL
jgi:hypothetical protein